MRFPAGNKYFGQFTDRDSVANEFFRAPWPSLDQVAKIPSDFPTDEEIIFASYGGRSYEGDAQVVFERDGKLYEVNGGHCSCYGLEDQWATEDTSLEALKLQANAKSDGYYNHVNCTRLRENDHDDAAIARFYELFGGVK